MYDKNDDPFVNLILPLAIYRPTLTSALGGNKHANGLQLTSGGSAMTKVWP
jgi:hypothetical protein